MKTIRTMSAMEALRQVPELEATGVDYSLVSILSPPSPEKMLSFVDLDRDNHLFLCFDDAPSRDWANSMQLPTKDDIQRLLDVADTLLEADEVVCHCEAGVSRSTATAFILQCLHHREGNEEDAYFDVLKLNTRARPNKIMIEIADKLMDRGGAMLEALALRPKIYDKVIQQQRWG